MKSTSRDGGRSEDLGWASSNRKSFQGKDFASNFNKISGVNYMSPYTPLVPPTQNIAKHFFAKLRMQSKQRVTKVEKTMGNFANFESIWCAKILHIN